jgi:type IV pilus assembly protein PilP
VTLAPRTLAVFFFCALAALLAGCGDDPASNKPDPFFSQPPSARGASTSKPGGPAAPGASAKPGASGAAAAGAPQNLPPLPVEEFTEADFSPSDKSRDPFRSFARTFVAQAKGRITVQRVVLAERFALDELKIVGIVSRGDVKVLLTDSTGLGWIVKVGDYVGKPEVVHTGGPTGADVAINWRVDRIRENDVVFVREDPSHPEIPPTTRVVALYPSDQNPSQPFGPR